MARKHLHELLSEDQGPFVLVDYINERRSQLQKPTLQLQKRKPISPASTKFRKNSCFFAQNSPLFEFPERSPCRKTAPPKTAALLLEAAMKVQKQSPDPKCKLKIGFFGSILKRMMMRKRSRNREICVEEIPVKGITEMGFSCSCNTSVWTESNEDKSMDSESSSCASEEFEEMEFAKGRNDEDLQFADKIFCESPFHFGVFASSPDSRCRTPEFLSPARSSYCRKTEVMEGRSEEGSLGGTEKEEEEDKEKEQFSPVSVFDAPFTDEYEGHEEEDGDDEEDFQHNFASVQRSRHMLLNKIRRFERLAKLDPLELEKILAEEEDEDSVDNEAYEHQAESLASEHDDRDDLLEDILCMSHICSQCKVVPRHMKRLVLDLIREETGSAEAEELAKKVSKKIDLWTEVESNTVDMMVELDFRMEGNMWKKSNEEVKEVGVVIDHAIFNVLVEELSADLVDLGRA